MPRVLLIEHEPDIAGPLARLIHHAGASQVDWADSVERALRLDACTGYDILIADFDLGRGDHTGVSVLERLRKERPESRTCIVISPAPRTVPPWCTFVSAADPARLAAIIAAWS